MSGSNEFLAAVEHLESIKPGSFRKETQSRGDISGELRIGNLGFQWTRTTFNLSTSDTHRLIGTTATTSLNVP